MFELIGIVLVCGVMAKAAHASEKSFGKWLGISIAACAASLLIPLPFLRVLIAAVVVFAAMMFSKN